MHSHPTSSCLPAEIVVNCSYVVDVMASPPVVQVPRLGALLYGGVSASFSGTLCDGTGTIYHLSP